MNSNTICNKKTFPAKYLKYLSYGIHIMKQLYPADEEYQQKVADYLKFSESVNVIIDDIESSLTDENETEVKELKKSLAKKPKRIRNKKPNATKTITLTEQIVELANEPTIKRGPDPDNDVEYVIAVSDSEGEEEVKELPKEVVIEAPKVVKKKATKRVKKADIDDDPRPDPTWVELPATVAVSDSEGEEEVVKVVVEEVKPKVVVEEVKPAKKKAAKKTEIVVPKVVVKEQLDLTMEMELPKEVPKKVSKPRVKKVVEKKPEEVQQPAVVVEELTEENEV